MRWILHISTSISFDTWFQPLNNMHWVCLFYSQPLMVLQEKRHFIMNCVCVCAEQNGGGRWTSLTQLRCLWRGRMRTTQLVWLSLDSEFLLNFFLKKHGPWWGQKGCFLGGGAWGVPWPQDVVSVHGFVLLVAPDGRHIFFVAPLVDIRLTLDVALTFTSDH